MVHAEHVKFSYHADKNVLRDVCLKEETGHCIALLGNNGVGKSTFLKCFNRILNPDSGTVLVENLNEDSENWAHNDDDDDHRTTVLDDILLSIGVGLDAGIETGGEIGDFLLGLPGKVVGGAVGSVVGAVGGAVSQILFNIFG